MPTDRPPRRATFRAAPWRPAAWLAITWLVGLVVAFVIADVGGWSRAWPSGGATAWVVMVGGPDPTPTNLERAITAVQQSPWLPVVIAVLGAAAAGAAWVRLRWVLLVVLAVLGAAVAAHVRDEQHLGYATLILGPGDVPRTASMSITMAGVVALLLALAVLLTLVLCARRPPAGGRERRSPRSSPVRAGLALATWMAFVLPAPRLAKLAADAGHAAFGWTADAFDGPQTFFLLGLATIAACLVAGAAPRRAPVVALAAGMVTSALWIPLFWLAAGPLSNWSATAELIDAPWFPLVLWGVAAVTGVALGVLCAMRTGRAAPRLPASRP